MKSCVYVVMLLLLSLLLGCEESKYDTLDFSSHEADVVLDEPLNFFVQAGNDYIFVSWDYPKNQTISVLFSLYRSETENGEFQLLADDVSKLYYYDYLVEPEKVYYYKVCAKSMLYGESDFSEIKSGKRKGRGVDEYEGPAGNNKKENSTKIELGKLYKSSLYISCDATADDVDYYTLDAKKGDIFKITVKLPSQEDSNAAPLSAYDIAVYSDLATPIFSARGQFLTYDGKSYLIFFTRDTPVYICISPDSTSTTSRKTGDYDLIVTTAESSEFFSAYSSSCISYVKILWSSYFSLMASKYIVQRRKQGADEWESVKGALSPYRLDVQSEFARDCTEMYDRSAEVGVPYEYRVGAYLGTEGANEVCFYSSVVEARRYDVQKNVLPANTADNTSFDNALKIEQGQSVGGAIDTADCRYYKIALEAGKKYSFLITSDLVLFSADFFFGKENSDKERLICIKPEESTRDYGTFLYTVDDNAAGEYWLRIDGNNTQGNYFILVKEVSS